ncbi:MAG TPA: DUF924 family protein, partial [Denitromonas sp.]|nr:DUF924 family protein [Denitromonas sp.]
MPTLPDTARQVLDFWFGAPGSADYGTHRPLWFEKRDATDAAITKRFGALVDQALAGALTDWD